MFFTFDGGDLKRVPTLGEAISESKDAIDCYADQCDPGWPEEVEDVCFGVVLGIARRRKLTDEELVGTVLPNDYDPATTEQVKYEIDDGYTDYMKAETEKFEGFSDRYGYTELVHAIEDQGMTMLPGLLAAAVTRSLRAGVFRSTRALMKFVYSTMLQAGAIPNALPRVSTNPEGLHRRYHIELVDGTPVDPNGVYWVLRLDNGGDDKLHTEACRAAALAYADYVQGSADTHMAQVGADLRQRCRLYASETF